MLIRLKKIEKNQGERKRVILIVLRKNERSQVEEILMLVNLGAVIGQLRKTEKPLLIWLKKREKSLRGRKMVMLNQRSQVERREMLMGGDGAKIGSTPLPRGFECERRERDMHKEWERGRIKTHTVEGNCNIFLLLSHAPWVGFK